MAELVARFTSQPKVDEPVVSPTASSKPKKLSSQEADSEEFSPSDLDTLRASLRDDN